MVSRKASAVDEGGWRAVIAAGAVARDVSIVGVARYAGVHVAEAEAALLNAREAELIDEHGTMTEINRLGLIAELPPHRVAEIHASIARHLFAKGPSHLLDAVGHARAAGTLVAMEEMVAMADRGGQLSLSVGDYESARELLQLAAELDISDSRVRQGNRLCELAAALDGLGDVLGAREHLARAATLGELEHDGRLVARAAVQYSLPTDWYTGDLRASGLLQRASSMSLMSDDRVRVQAARAIAEHRIPLVDDDGQQLAWVTRPTLARGLAEEALAASATCPPDVRLLALLAWRTTHRAPKFLTQRLAASAEALDLAQQLQNTSLLIDAAVVLAVDSLESADRPAFDRALAVARWVAERDGNPRLRWRALTLAAGAAHLDGDRGAASDLRNRARQAGAPLNIPGWLSAELLLRGQEIITDPAATEDDIAPFLLEESSPALANPIGCAGVGLLYAMQGDLATAERFARRAFRQLDEEASYLVLATRVAAIAVRIEPTDLAHDLIEKLQPWQGHVAVDSNGWCCDGPVEVTLAELHLAVGDYLSAQQCLERGTTMVRSIGDARGLERCTVIRSCLDAVHEDAEPAVLGTGPLLSEREMMVLARLGTDSTYAAIAKEIAFSASTVRNDAVSIYRKLGVRGRSQAVLRAIALGIIRP